MRRLFGRKRRPAPPYRAAPLVVSARYRQPTLTVGILNEDEQVAHGVTLVLQLAIHTTSERTRVEEHFEMIDASSLVSHEIEMLERPIRAWWFATWTSLKVPQRASGSVVFFR